MANSGHSDGSKKEEGFSAGVGSKHDGEAPGSCLFSLLASPILLSCLFLLILGDDFDTVIHENLTDETFGELGSGFTIQTVTQTDVELYFPRNVTEEEARGSIATLEPIDFTATASELDEGFTATPDLFATDFIDEAENRTEVGIWESLENATVSMPDTLFTTDIPEVSSVEETLWATATPALESASPFTVEDQIVPGTAAPDIGHIPRQPTLSTGNGTSFQTCFQL